MTAWRLLMRAVAQVLDNLGVALQISVALILVQTFVGEPLLARAVLRYQGWMIVPGRFIWGLWAAGLAASILPALWIAVGWHRFIILGERPWFVLPRLRSALLWSYGWRLVVVILLMCVVGAVVLFLLMGLLGVIGLIGARFTGSDAAFGTTFSIAFMLGLLPAAVGACYLWLRLSPVIVVGALGRSCDITTALETTQTHRRTILGLSVGFVGVFVMFALLQGLLNAAGVGPGLYGLVSNWFATMLGVSVMTAVYEMVDANAPAETPV